jgi:hypothetical protein
MPLLATVFVMAAADVTSFLCLLSIGRAKKVSRPPAGTGDVEVRGFAFDFRRSELRTRYAIHRTESTPAGRVPPDALLFVQTATKSKQKTPSPPGGDVRRGELEEITTFGYIRR